MSDKDSVIAKFGFDPDTVGNRNRGWWIIDKVDEEEEWAGAEIGDLCVKTRDGGTNPIDAGAFKVGNCIGSSEDGFDRTYRYYYYRAVACQPIIEWTPTPVEVIARQVADAIANDRDGKIRAALITLGWTPPPEPPCSRR